MKALAFAFAVIAFGLLGACTPAVVHQPVHLPIAARPTLPPVAGSDLQCLAPDAYRRVVMRERDLKQWGLENEAILKANNAKAKGAKQ